MWWNGEKWTFTPDGKVTVGGVPLGTVPDEGKAAYARTDALLRLSGVTERTTKIANVLYHCLLAKTANHADVRKAFQLEMGEVPEAFVQLASDGHLAELTAVVKALDDALKTNGLPGVV